MPDLPQPRARWRRHVSDTMRAYSLGREAFLAAVGGPSACRAAAEQLAADRMDANATPRSPS